MSEFCLFKMVILLNAVMVSKVWSLVCEGKLA